MRLKLGRLFLVSIFIIAILTAPSLAVKTVTYTSDLPPKNVGSWDRNHTLPLFDPALGNLVAVNFTASLNATADAKAENVAPDGGVDDAYIDVDADMYVDMINGDRLTLVLNLATTPTDLSAFDGVLDYGGTSGFSIIKEGDTVGSIYYNDARKDAYVGMGTIDLKAHATAKSKVVGSGTWESRLNTYSWSNSSITYTYDECHSCISGYKLDKCNGALADWNITLTNGTYTAKAKTDSTGKYEFCGLMPGSYTLTEELQKGWMPVSAPGPVTLDCKDVSKQNFTNQKLMCISGYKLDKCNGALADWNITLTNGTYTAKAKTDSTGKYEFCGLWPGVYTLTEELQTGWMPVSAPGPVTLVCDNATKQNFTNQKLLCIRGYKINSSTGAGLPNWNITLTNSSSSVKKQTGPDGRYEFCNLLPGSYTVCEELKDGWKNITPSCITIPLGCKDSNDNNFTNVPERETACNTFWANWNGKGTCLIPSCSKNWGWYMKPSIAELKLGMTSDLWAGVGGCDPSKGYNVGTVDIRLDSTGKFVTLHFNITGVNDDCDMDGWHLWISDSSLCPHKGFSKWITGTAEDIKVNLKDELTDKDKDGVVFVAVHGVACCDKCGTQECTYH